jgi:hypothetical protein
MVSSGDSDLRLYRDSSMFVNTIQLVEAPKRIRTYGRGCRPIVWLNRLDVGNSLVGQTLNLPVEILPVLGAERLGEDREFTGPRIPAGPMMNQGPNGLIECSSQTLKNIPKDQKDIHMGLLKFDPISNPIQLRFLLDRDCMGIFAEGGDLLSQEVQVKLCPLGLEMSIC